MTDLLRRVDLSRLPETGRLIIGFSGGADSVALAHVLAGAVDKNRLCCVHVHHGIRGPEADRDAEFAAAFCKAQGLPFLRHDVDVPALAKEMKLGLEACGRQLRYAFFESLITGDQDRILTAHHADDQAETVLMHLLQGTGLTGLCGMPARRGAVERPLLAVTRGEIEAYCAENGLEYVTDSTNEDEGYLRNRLRKQMLPLLKEENPQFLSQLTSLTQELTQTADYLDTQARLLLEQAKTGAGYRLSVFQAAHPALRARALTLCLQQHSTGRITRRHVTAVEENLVNGRSASLPGGVRWGCSRGLLTFCPEGREEAWAVPVGMGETLLPNGKRLVLRQVEPKKCVERRKVNNLLFNSSLDCDTITKVLIARNRRPGDRFAPAGRNGTRALKKLLPELGVPAALREDVVLLADENGPVLLEGCGPAAGHEVCAGTRRVLEVFLLQDSGQALCEGTQ